MLHAVVLAVPAILPAQPVCLPQLFQTGAFASLTPSGSSQQFLLRQSDGSYTAVEIPDTAPYQVLSTVPNFARQVRNCPNPEPSDVPPPFSTGIYAATPSGGYMYAVSPNPTGDNAEVDVTFFDHDMNPVSSTAVTIPGFEFENLSFQPLLIVDLNHDGNPDLVLQQCSFLDPTEPSCALAVMLADGHGSFAQPVAYPLPIINEIGAVVAADLNGDGYLDLVIDSFLYVPGEGEPLGIAVLLNNGDGTFQPLKVVVPGVSAFGLAVADLNQDGKPDLAFSYTTGSSTSPSASVSVALGNGDGTFGTPVSYPVNGAGSIAIGDVNGDGNEDIVVETGSILFGDGKGGFPTRRDYLFGCCGPVILTDFDGDGKIDVVIAGAGNSQIMYGGVLVFFGQGGGEFAAPPFLNITNFNGTYPTVLASGDFDGNGTLDLLVTQASTIGILQGNSDGTFTAATQYNFNPAAGVANGAFLTAVTGDFNHDGKLDFAVVGSGPNNSLIQVFLGNGDGTFQPPVSTPFAAEINAITVGDFNGDGIPDLAAGAGPPYADGDTVQILLGNGDGTFRQGAQYPAEPGVEDIVAADFNGDGKLDLAVANVGVSASPEPTGSNVTILLGQGDGTFSTGAVLPLTPDFAQGTAGRLLTAADFNNDGKIDLAVAESDYIAVLLGHGDGTFSAPMTYEAQILVSAFDVNGDHILDLITGSGVMLGNGDGSFQPPIPVNIDTANFGVEGDFNHSGTAEFLAGDAIIQDIATAQSSLSVVSAATLAVGPLAPESLATAWGVNLANTTEASQTLTPSLAGTTVSVKDSTGTVRAAPLLYASPHQVNFFVPAGTSTGPATVTVMNGMAAQTASVFIAQVAPALFILNENALAAAYAIIVSPDGTQTIENAFTVQNGNLVASPIAMGSSGQQLYLVLFGTGMHNANASQITVGNPTPDNWQVVDFEPGADGVDQIKVLVPTGSFAHVPNVPIAVIVQGADSNTVYLSFQ